MPRPSQDGLEWEEKTFGIEPRWTREPAIKAIENVCRQRLIIPPDDSCEISFHASGAFNKLYTVESSEQTLIMRVSLPVCPRDKTRGEVSTLQWVSNHTQVPVPKVISFDDSSDNEIGFEWSLMEFVRGTSAYTRWRTLSMEHKVAITRQLAEFQAEFLGCRFEAVGTLQEGGSTQESGIFRPGQLVSHGFFMGDRLHYNIPRGPFYSSHDWMSAQLNIVLLEQTAKLEKAEDEDDQEDAEDCLSTVRKLLDLLPTVFPPGGGEPASLYHNDLHLNNIFIDENGKITSVLDWECVSAVPLWLAITAPKFLEETPREEEPQRDEYADESDAEREDPHSLDNEGKNDLYWIHRMEYDATQLQKVYKARLEELTPELPLKESFTKVEFFRAVEQCDGIWVKKAGRWADRTKQGEVLQFVDA
ncbi:unnamed protein product [Periconia digitata]|uniref:Aminoglycoside phosphotransferase domain-containing protein n=1 Tax=Periconia digitata TaxID=1303443 RepID=A0A9W4UQD0_9PLEO|nr:unnamed protein product [Periconia digitata]